MRTIANSLVLSFSVIVSASSVFAEDGHMDTYFGALAVGTVEQTGENMIHWKGAFSGTVFDQSGEGLFHQSFAICPGESDMNLAEDTFVGAGTCTHTDGAGSTIAWVWQCEGTLAGCEGTGTLSDGTGKWEGMTAEGVFHALNGPLQEDGTQPMFAVWSIDYSMP